MPYSIEDENIPVICCISDCDEIAETYDLLGDAFCSICAEEERKQYPQEWEDDA